MQAGEYGTGGRRAGLSKGPEQQAAVDVAGGILDGGQIEGLGLRPVTWDIVEILGIGRDLLKDAPGSLDVGEVLFALVFTWALFQQTVLAPDALQSTMAEGKIELSNETASAEGKQLVAQSHNLPFDVGGSFPRLVMRRARKFEQAGRSLLLIPTHHLRTVATVVWKSRAVGLMPCWRACATRRKRWL